MAKLTDALLLASLVQQTLDITRNGACALVNDHILGFMVQYARETHPLLLATAQHIFPLLTSVPPALAVGKITQLGLLEHALEVVFRLTLLAHVLVSVRVDDLITQGADAEVGALGQEHDAVLARRLGSADETAIDGPQAGENAGDGRLADAVGAGDLFQCQ